MTMKVKTLHCEACDREITPEEWDVYVGENAVLLERPEAKPYFRCGCDGREKAAGMRILACVNFTKPGYGGTFTL